MPSTPRFQPFKFNFPQLFNRRCCSKFKLVHIYSVFTDLLDEQWPSSVAPCIWLEPIQLRKLSL